jgi:hypothetical protein
MGRVWLGATHSSRPPSAGPAPAGVVHPHSGTGRALLPQPAQQHSQRDEPGGPADDRRPRWLRWLGRP